MTRPASPAPAPEPHPNLSQWHSLQDAYENGLRDGRAEALEEAAKHLLTLQDHPSPDLRKLAAAIRALKDKP